MQNKGFIKFFATLLVLVCAYYLSFSFVTRHYANQARVYAAGDLSKEVYYLDSLSTEKVWLTFSWLGLKDAGYTLKECREREINLGLDLKGGMNVIMEMNVADVLRALSGHNQDPNFNQALSNAVARQNKGDNKDFVSLFVEEYEKIDPGVRLSVIFTPRELNNSNQKVIEYLRTELKGAVDNSFNVLRTRIDRFGVVSPNIQKLETDGRILVELPGIKEPERVRKLLQGSANLEFWETYELAEIYPQLMAANDIIRDFNRTHEPAVTDSVKTETSQPEVETAEKDTTALSEADKLLAEINKTDSASIESQDEAAWRRNYPLFAVLTINQNQGQIVPGPVVGIVHYRDTATVNKYLNMRQVREILPRNLVLKWTVKAIDAKEQYYQLVALKGNRKGQASLSGDVVTDARSDYAQNSAFHEVSMTMNQEGAKKWGIMTKDNLNRCIAIVLDNYIYSYPRVNTEITGGRSQITGNFTPQEGKDLENVLKSGKMAASVRIVQEDVIGPSLGQEAINAGFWSFIVAAILLMAYMCLVYGFVPGMIANSALLLNLFFTMGALAAFGSVLTLSGIAGLVLSIAMAVDANVLIYERIREELRAGKVLKKAVDDGYKNAFSAIFDANLTSIITGAILLFGSGPVKGFAVTLIIGIIASFITAVFLTRIVYEYFLGKGKLQKLTFTTPFMKDFLLKPKFNFIGFRRKGYMIVGGYMLVGLIALVTLGLNPGIDFTGGRNYIVRFDKPVATHEIEAALDPSFEGQLSVITIGSSNQVRISTNYKINENTPEVDREIEQKMYEGLTGHLGGADFDTFIKDYVQSSQKVGPTIADDIKNKAIWATVIAMICMALYVLLRFRDIAFSVGTLLAALHDALFIVFAYALLWKIMPFSMEIDQTFIAAILTVIGYSMNDTVVIFDRIREISRNYPKRSLASVINESLNTTLSRTFNTVFSTLVVVVTIFILGGTTIRSFIFAMLLGVIVGVFSTLYLAVPVAYDMIKKSGKNKGRALEEGNPIE